MIKVIPSLPAKALHIKDDKFFKILNGFEQNNLLFS